MKDHPLNCTADKTEKGKNVLSVIIPIYNEKKTVRELLNRVLHAEHDSFSLEVILVDDGSTDGTSDILRQWLKEYQPRNGESVHLHFLEHNSGKGAAVKKGVSLSTGNVVIVQDADLEYDPNDYSKCVTPILSGEYDVVYGSREDSNKNRLYSSPFFYLGALSLTVWMNVLFNANLTDEATCYKAFRGNLARLLIPDLEGNGFEWEPEITAKLLRLGFHPYEVPISYYPRSADEGKKIRLADGVLGFWIAFLWRFRSMDGLRKQTAALSAESEKHVLHAVIAQKMLFRLTIFIFCLVVLFGQTIPQALTFSASFALSYLTARLYHPWKKSIFTAVLATVLLFCDMNYLGHSANPYLIAALQLQMFFFLKFMACGLLLFFVIAEILSVGIAFFLPWNILWTLPAFLYVMFFRPSSKERPFEIGAVLGSVLLFFLLRGILTPSVSFQNTILSLSGIYGSCLCGSAAVSLVMLWQTFSRKRKFKWKHLFIFASTVLLYGLIQPLYLHSFFFCFHLKDSRFKKMSD